MTLFSNIPKQTEDAGFMASRFRAIFLLGRQSELALAAKAEKKKEAKDAKAETGIFSLFGYKNLIARDHCIMRYFEAMVSSNL